MFMEVSNYPFVGSYLFRVLILWFKEINIFEKEG